MNTDAVDSEAEFFLLPPHSGACQICGRYPAHPVGDPHDAQSMYYQYAFWGEHGRWPTWKDALEHCAPDVRAKWESELRELGAWSEPGK